MLERDDYHIRKEILKNNINIRDVINMVNNEVFNYFFSPRKFKTKIKNFNHNIYMVPVWIISGNGSAKCLAEKTTSFTETVNGEEIKKLKTEQYHKTKLKKINWAVAAHDPTKPECGAIKYAIDDYNRNKPLIRIDWGYTKIIHQFEEIYPLKKYHEKGIFSRIFKPDILGYGNYLLKSSTKQIYQIEKKTRNMSELEQVLSIEDAKEIIINNTKTEIERSLRETGETIKDVNISYEFDKIKLAFIPIWVISYKFEGKKNYGVINGYNGEPIRILIPPSFWAGAISLLIINIFLYTVFGSIFSGIYEYLLLGFNFLSSSIVFKNIIIVFSFLPLVITILLDAKWFLRITRN